MILSSSGLILSSSELIDIVFLGVYLVLLQLRLEVIDFLLHDLGLLLDLSLDLGTKLGNPLLDVYVDGAGVAVDSAVVGGLWWRYCGRAWHSTAGDSRTPQGGAAPAARQGVPLKRRGHVTEAEAVGGHGPAGHALHQAGVELGRAQVTVTTDREQV